MAPRSVFTPGLFATKSAIVTGGGTGIGHAITSELLHLGCRVLICSRSEAKLAAALALHPKAAAAGHLVSHACNLRKEDSVGECVAAAVEKFGRIDILVNNGGGQFISPAEVRPTPSQRPVPWMACSRRAHSRSLESLDVYCPAQP